VKALYCSCGHRVFFDSNSCLACGLQLGFDPDALCMRSLVPAATGTWQDSEGRQFRLCGNHGRHGSCNWLVPSFDPEPLCISCRLTEIVPNLERPGNLLLWSRLELAKRRLLYTLLSLRLPLKNHASGQGLRFRFLEDQRRNPDVMEDFVSTGHLAGAITINLAEASDAERHALREQMMERYRTVLGHLRHESGHYYFNWLVNTPETLAGFRALFGDERQDYAAALQHYYEHGPASGWQSRFVSAYASAHPWEDWAESFAHYLHVLDVLETARTFRLAPPGGERPAADWLREWGDMVVTLNELNRSLGLEDAYPFVLTEPVRARLEFIRRLVEQHVGQQSAPAAEADSQTHS